MPRSYHLLLALAATAVALTAAWLWHDDAPPHPVTIGALHLSPVDAATFAGFKASLEDAGYRDGERVHLRYLGAAGRIERLDAMVAKVLDPPMDQKPVDLIFVSSTPAALAVQQAVSGTRLPVVFAPVNDPVAASIVEGLRAPGGNLTGIRLPHCDALRLYWLLRAVPGTDRVLLPYSPYDQIALQTLRQVLPVAEPLGVELVLVPIADPTAVEQELLPRLADVDAIFLPRDSCIEAHIDTLVAIAEDHRLPLSVPSLTQVRAGALLSYGFIHEEIGRRAAQLVLQVLDGVPPAELPVETADGYLALNLATARRIGLTLPPEVLRQAQVVIREPTP